MSKTATVDRRRSGVRAARSIAREAGVTSKADGWLSALLTNASPPVDRRGAWTFEVEVGGAPYRFLWASGCKVCRALRRGQGPDEGPDHPEGPSVYATVNELYLAGASSAEIWRAVQPLTSHWPIEHRLSIKAVERHTGRHVAVELQARLMIARDAVAAMGQAAAKTASGVTEGYAAARVMLARARQEAVSGALRAGGASDVARLTALVASIERDLVGRASENEWVATVYRLGKAMENRIPREMFDLVIADFREMMGRPAPAVEALARGELRDPNEVPDASEEAWGDKPAGNQEHLSDEEQEADQWWG